jgi:CelD/BcsL family acetyltransferase involved in cellulose biosynthesis
MQVSEITTSAQFDRLSPKWEELCTRTGQETPFHTPDWFRCCLSAYAGGSDLYTLAFEDGTDLAGIAALWRARERRRGLPFQLRKLSFVSCPDSPFVDIVVLKERRAEMLGALLQYLRNNADWDVLTLDRWPATSPNCEMFRDLLRHERMRVSASIDSSTPYISVQGDWESFLKTRSVKFRKTHRNILNRIANLGTTEIHCAREDAGGQALRHAMTVSAKGWKHEQGIAMTSREESKRFFSELTSVAAARGWLNLWLLTSHQVPVAMEYDLTCHGVTYALRADFDEGFKEFSPGTFLEYHIMKQLFDSGSLEYSTGPGLNQYKLHWTESVRENLRLQVYNNTFRGRLAWWMENSVIPALRLVKRKAARARGIA